MYNVRTGSDGDSLAEKLVAVAVRVDPHAHLILSYETVLRRSGSMQNLLRPVLEEYASELAKKPAMKAILEADASAQTSASKGKPKTA